MSTNEVEQGPTVEQAVEQEEAVQEEVVQEEAVQEQDGDEAGKAGREAAKYRRALRDTEAQRDALAQQVAGLQRAAVERVAAAHLAKPEALWVAGVDLADLLDGAGVVDEEKVRTAAREAADRLGLSRPLGNYVPKEGQPTRADPGPSFSDAFRHSGR
ncbi:hypothetical protein ATK17_0839 [Branchiibius hedensis]|uniref:Scaffolding protein n=1 Tax=Branchiibius hedensis TaxID=672460 RepID=A0A2Y8ZNL4_9MICO|nr:hypothetical protein [Branchiibius hedensis]PWJ24738.1 hypothetical protein ATK17_0839 [Branchiibius hedensis]SSA33555.1 hypothetical protein SAMN04489750_0839 [Branchiibius hedensis]